MHPQKDVVFMVQFLLLKFMFEKMWFDFQFTSIDVEGHSQTEKGDDAVEAFKSLFRFNDQNSNTEKNFQFKILQKKSIEMLFKWLGVLMINLR